MSKKLKHMLMVEFEGEKISAEDMSYNICSWDTYNKNDDTTCWSEVSYNSNTILIAVNAMPNLDYEELFEESDFDLLRVYTVDIDIDSVPHYCTQDHIYDEMKSIYEKILGDCQKDKINVEVLFDSED